MSEAGVFGHSYDITISTSVDAVRHDFVVATQSLQTMVF